MEWVSHEVESIIQNFDYKIGQIPESLVIKYGIQAQFINKSLFIFLIDGKNFVYGQFSPIGQSLLEDIQNFYTSNGGKYDIKDILISYIGQPWKRDKKGYFLD